MIVDAHVHVFTRASGEFPRQVHAHLPAEREAPVERLLERMQEHGVARAVLVQIGGVSYEHHAYLRHCLRTYPEHFVGIGLVDVQAPSIADHMDRLADDGAIIGFRLSSLGGPADPFAPVDVRRTTTYPVWQRAAERDYVIWLYPRAVDAHLVPHFFEAFPQVRVVFNHLMVCPGEGKFSWKGRPRVEVSMPPQTRYSTMGLKIGRIPDNTRGLYPYENVCVHLSGHYAFSRRPYPYLDLAEWQRNILATFGADRLMWASDFPWIDADPGYGRIRHLLDELLPELGGRERAQIMGGTAQRFLRLK